MLVLASPSALRKILDSFLGPKASSIPVRRGERSPRNRNQRFQQGCKPGLPSADKGNSYEYSMIGKYQNFTRNMWSSRRPRSKILTTEYLEQPLAATKILNHEWTRIFTNKNVYTGVRWECTFPARRATDILAQGNALGKRCRTVPSPVRAAQWRLSLVYCDALSGLNTAVSFNPGRCPGLICSAPLGRDSAKHCLP